MKKAYESPELEISWFELEDVIAASIFIDDEKDDVVSGDGDDNTMGDLFG